MLVPGKSVKSGPLADCLHGPNVLETAVQERETMREMAREFEQQLMAVQMASMDSLTLLTNLHGFQVLGQLWLDACQQLGKPASLLFFDLDYFKRINQLYGRSEGDSALKTFADVLRIAFRESDVVGRVGGDEFAVLLTGASAVDVAGVRARLEEMLDERNATVHRGYDIRFNIGQIEYDASLHHDVEELLAQAERALHR